MPEIAETPTSPIASAPATEAIPPSSQQSSIEAGSALTGTEAPQPTVDALSPEEIDEMVGKPPADGQFERIKDWDTSNTRSRTAGMSLLEENRMEARLANVKPADLSKEKQRIEAEFKSGGILSRGEARDKYAAEEPITAEVTYLPIDEKTDGEKTINIDQQARQNEQTAQSNSINQSPSADGNTVKLSKTVAEYEARMANLNAEKVQNKAAAAQAIPPGAAAAAKTPEPSSIQSTDPNKKPDGGSSPRPEKKYPPLTVSQLRIISQIKESVGRLKDINVRSTEEVLKMSPAIKELSKELEESLDITNHHERALQLEGILLIIGGIPVDKVIEAQLKSKGANIEGAIIGVLKRFTQAEKKLDLQHDLPDIQNEIVEYVHATQMGDEDLAALREALEKTNKKLTKSAIADILKIILAAMGNELWNATGQAISTQQAA